MVIINPTFLGLLYLRVSLATNCVGKNPLAPWKVINTVGAHGLFLSDEFWFMQNYWLHLRLSQICSLTTTYFRDFKEPHTPPTFCRRGLFKSDSLWIPSVTCSLFISKSWFFFLNVPISRRRNKGCYEWKNARKILIVMTKGKTSEEIKWHSRSIFGRLIFHTQKYQIKCHFSVYSDSPWTRCFENFILAMISNPP